MPVQWDVCGVVGCKQFHNRQEGKKSGLFILKLNEFDFAMRSPEFVESLTGGFSCITESSGINSTVYQVLKTHRDLAVIYLLIYW